jgi:hypothetical protein
MSTPPRTPEALLEALEPYAPGLIAFIPVRELTDGFGYGRIQLQVDQVIFQYLLIKRRILAIEAGMNFFEVEKKVQQITGRQKFGEIEAVSYWLIEYAAWLRVTTGDDSAWKAIL